MSLVRREEGYLLPITLALLLAMILGGLAMLTLVDSQTAASGRERERDASFNVAETVAEATRAALVRTAPERGWPDKAPGQTGAQPWVTTACSSQTLDSGSTLKLATDIASVVAPAASFRGGAAPSWRVRVCDDKVAATPASAYRDSQVLNNGAAGWDADGDGRVWVRAQATVNGRTTVVASLVSLTQGAPTTTTSSTTTGSAGTTTTGTQRLRFPDTAQLVAGNVVLNPTNTPDVRALMGLPNFTTRYPDAQPFMDLMIGTLTTTSIVQNDSGGTGTVNLRCRTLSGLCAAGTGSADTADVVPLYDTELPGPRVVDYGSTTVAGDEGLAALRSYAQSQGTLYSTRTDGSACAGGAAPTNSGATWVIFVDKVGTGDGTCTIPTGTQFVAVVVAQGRIRVTGSGELNGVVYAANQQSKSDNRTNQVISIDAGVSVHGAVWADYGGTVGMSPFTTPTFATLYNSQDFTNYYNNNNVQARTGRTLANERTYLGASSTSYPTKLDELIKIYGGSVFTVMTSIQNQIQTSGHKSGTIYEQDRINRVNTLVASSAGSQSYSSSSGGTSTTTDTTTTTSTVTSGRTFQQVPTGG